MDADKRDRLIGGYLAGSLPDAECAELAELVRTSPEAREALIQHLLADRYLGEAAQRPMNADRVMEAITSAGSPRFADQVLSRVRPATRRKAIPGRPDPAALAWKLGFAAAALFATVLVFLALSTSDPAPVADNTARLQAAREEIRRAVERAATQAREEREQIARDLVRAEEQKRALADEMKRTQDEQKRVEVKAREADLERAAAEFRARLEAAREKERLAREAVEKVSPPAPAPPEKRGDTLAALAQIESARDALLVTAGAKVPLAGGEDLLANQGILVGETGSVVVRYPDNTRLELGPGSETREFRGDRGKRIYVAKGTVAAVVSPQPAGRPFVLATPHGDATVLGTTLRITVDPDPKKGTRLEIIEGKVQLKGSRGKPVEVVSGHYAIAAVGVELVARISAAGQAQKVLDDRGGLTIKFGHVAAKVPEDVLIDLGDEFDAGRGYGWSVPNGNVPGIVWQGQPMWRRNAQQPLPGAKNPLTGSAMSVGWSTHKETWRMPAANGPYLVTVVVGDLGAYAQGPHHVWIEGRQIVNAVVTKAGETAEFKDIPVDVADGELTMIVGGSGKDLDGTSDTKLCFLTIRRSRR